MKTISEIIQECCGGLDYDTTIDVDTLRLEIRINKYMESRFFNLNELNARIALEETLSWELNQLVKCLKQQAHVLKRGDIIREYGYGTFVESTIITDVVINDRGRAEFVSETKDGDKINYMKHRESLEAQGL